MGHLGHAKPHLSAPRKSQQSGKFIHHNAKYLLGLDLLLLDRWMLKRSSNNAIQTLILNVDGSIFNRGLKQLLYGCVILIFQFQGKLHLMTWNNYDSTERRHNRVHWFFFTTWPCQSFAHSRMKIYIVHKNNVPINDKIFHRKNKEWISITFLFFLAKIFDNLVYHKHTYAISFWFVSSFVPLVDRFYLRELLVKSSTSVLSFFFAGFFVGAWSSFNETWGIEENKIKIFNL